MTRKQEQEDRHPDCLFLLPFNERPKCELINPDQKLSRSKADLRPDKSNRSFSTCVLRRTTDTPLTNGDTESSQQTVYNLQVGQYVFLQSIDNGTRPGVGKVLEFYIPSGRRVGEARIQWFYRGEDLGNAPSGAVGEDEVFETVHCDSVDLDSIVGRCAVTSYPEWLQAMRPQCGLASNGATQEATGNGGHARKASRRSQRLSAASKVENSHALSGNDDECDDVDYTDDSDDTNDTDEGNDMSHKVRSPSPELECTDEEDTVSLFECSYDNSSIRLFCRRFYDTQTQLFVTSKFECAHADPVEEMASLRCAERHVSSESDPEAELEAEPDVELEPEFDLAEKRGGRASVRKRARRGTARGGIRRRARGGGGIQFALPSELGVVESLPCRDAQKAHVKEFLLGVIRDAEGVCSDVSRSLYISGVPGTGKTATVREIVRDLRRDLANGNLPPFTVVELNAMSLADPGLVYVELYAALAGSRGIAPAHAAQLLEQLFADDAYEGRGGGNSGGGGVRKHGRTIENRIDGAVIVVLDEMDVLLARRQKVLYDLLEWPTRRRSRMAVIGIANTMDLPERMLPRLGSRLGLNRLVYPPYTSDQIMTILAMTLDQHEFTFKEEALKLCAMKIGGVSGDVRRALELCRRATELARETAMQTAQPQGAEDADKGTTETIEVCAQHIQRAVQEVAGNFRIVALNQLSLFEKLALVSAIALARRQGSFEVDATSSIEAVCETAHDVVVRNDEQFKHCGKPSPFDVEEACWRLAAQRMLVIEKAVVHRHSRVIVNIPVDDCIYALKECPLCSKVLSEP